MQKYRYQTGFALCNSLGRCHAQLTAKSTASPMCYCKVFHLSCFSGTEVKSSLPAYLYHFGKNGQNTLFRSRFALCQTEPIDCDSLEQTLEKADNLCRSGEGKRVLPGVVFAVLRVLSKFLAEFARIQQFTSSKYKRLVLGFFFPGIRYCITETLLNCWTNLYTPLKSRGQAFLAQANIRDFFFLIPTIFPAVNQIAHIISCSVLPTHSPFSIVHMISYCA